MCLLISQCSTKLRSVTWHSGVCVCVCVLRIAINCTGCYIYRSRRNTKCCSVRNVSCPVNIQTVLDLQTLRFCTLNIPAYITNQMHTSNVYKQYRHYCDMAGRNSSVGIAIYYGLDGPGIESAPVQTGSGTYPASCTMDTESVPGVQRQVRGLEHPLHLARRVKK
jgi:hypothetical protein